MDISNNQDKVWTMIAPLNLQFIQEALTLYSFCTVWRQHNKLVTFISTCLVNIRT